MQTWGVLKTNILKQTLQDENKKPSEWNSQFHGKIRWEKKLMICYLWSTYFVHENIYNKKVSGECETFIVHIISLSTKQGSKINCYLINYACYKKYDFWLERKITKVVFVY